LGKHVESSASVQCKSVRFVLALGNAVCWIPSVQKASKFSRLVQCWC